VDFTERPVIERYILSGLQAIRDNEWETAVEMYEFCLFDILGPAGLYD